VLDEILQNQTTTKGEQTMQSQMREFLTKLKVEGWVLDRTSGGHQIYKNPERKDSVVVPGHKPSMWILKRLESQLRNGSKFQRRELGEGNMTTQFSNLNSTPKPSPMPNASASSVKPSAALEAWGEPEWKPVHGYSDYEVSSVASVRRVYRTTASGVRTRLEYPIPVVVQMSRVGIGDRKTVTFALPGSNQKIQLNRVVAEAFISPAPPNAYPTPKNGDYLDCRASNLKWATRGEIKRAAIKAPVIARTAAPAAPEKADESKATKSVHSQDTKEKIITDEQVLAAATKFEDGIPVHAIGKMLGCSDPTAKKCLIKFFGPEGFEKIDEIPRSKRAKAAAEKKNPKAAVAFVQTIPLAPQPKAEMTTTNNGPVSIVAKPIPATKSEQPALSSGPAFNLSDIKEMNARIRDGEATVTLRMDVSSPTFLLFCSGQAKTGK